MSWTPPGRPAPAPARAAERTIFVMIKDARSVRVIERAHEFGREIVCLMASDLLWARVIRPTDETTVEAEAEAARVALLSRGWTPAT